MEIVNLLISAGAALDVQMFFEDSALTKAAKQGHTETVKSLLKAGAIVRPTDEAFLTPEMRDF